MTFEIPIGAPSGTGRTWAAPSDTELTATGKFAVWASIVSMLFLTQIALNIGEFPVSTDLICYALFTLYLLVSGYASLSFPSLLLFLIAAALAFFRMRLIGSSTISWTSLLLLVALYAPFSFRLKEGRDLQAVQKYVQHAFVSAATIIAVVGVAQIILVNALGATFLKNIHFVLPEAIRSAGVYQYSREDEGIVKANGFFLREPSSLSIVAALALMIEYYTRRRLRILGILTAGLVCAFSGSGVLAIVAGFLMPRSIGRIPLFFAAALGLTVLLFVIYYMQIPGLDIWFGRLTEFTTPNSSGYARFIAPVEMVQHSFDDGGVTTWLGNGAGSYVRETRLLHVKYEVNDPTWAKLIYEYGLFGFALISSILVIRLYSSGLRTETCNYFLLIWMISGVVLKPDFALLIWLLTLVPTPQPRSVARTRNFREQRRFAR
jgi:hypothetical protein